MGDRTDEVAALRAEVEHLRALVGPSESDHRALVAAAQRAEVEVRESQGEAGRLRGQIAEMTVQLARARQEQEWALTGRPRWRVATMRLRWRVATMRLRWRLVSLRLPRRRRPVDGA